MSLHSAHQYGGIRHGLSFWVFRNKGRLAKIQFLHWPKKRENRKSASHSGAPECETGWIHVRAGLWNYLFQAPSIVLKSPEEGKEAGRTLACTEQVKLYDAWRVKLCSTERSMTSLQTFWKLKCSHKGGIFNLIGEPDHSGVYSFFISWGNISASMKTKKVAKNYWIWEDTAGQGLTIPSSRSPSLINCKFLFLYFVSMSQHF